MCVGRRSSCSTKCLRPFLRIAVLGRKAARGLITSYLHLVNKVKQSFCRPQQEAENPRIFGRSAHESGKVSRTHRPPLPLQETSLVLISVRGWVDPNRRSAAGRIMSISNSNDSISNRTINLPACSAVPSTHPKCNTDVKNKRRFTVTPLHLPRGVQFHLYSSSNCRPIHAFHQNDTPYCSDKALRPVNVTAFTHSISCHRKSL